MIRLHWTSFESYMKDYSAYLSSRNLTPKLHARTHDTHRHLWRTAGIPSKIQIFRTKLYRSCPLGPAFGTGDRNDARPSTACTVLVHLHHSGLRCDSRKKVDNPIWSSKFIQVSIQPGSRFSQRNKNPRWIVRIYWRDFKAESCVSAPILRLLCWWHRGDENLERCFQV